jgi:hypothetical protein
VSRFYVIGVDPGATTGVCILSADGVVDAWQDKRNDSHRRLVEWVSVNKPNIQRIAIEDQFLGAPKKHHPNDPDQSQGTSAHAVIQVAKSAGHTHGWLLCAGFPEGKIVDVLPQTWRAKLGIKVKGREAKEDAARQMAGRSLRYLPSRSQTHLAEAFCIGQWCWNELCFSLESPLNRINPR